RGERGRERGSAGDVSWRWVAGGPQLLLFQLELPAAAGPGHVPGVVVGSTAISAGGGLSGG
ncbi:hypothetical protein D8M33_11820, partial [Micrococcus sp. HSID17245]